MKGAVEHDPNLTIAPSLWQELLSELHRRTEERHESGAFLLGHTYEHVRQVEQVVYYDDIDPHAYRTGIVVIHAASFEYFGIGVNQAACRSLPISMSIQEGHSRVAPTGKIP